MTIAQTLRAARELITPEERWTQGAMRRGGSFCTYAALDHVMKNHNSPLAVRNGLRRVLNGSSIIGFSDTHTHAEVLAKLDEAIALAEIERK